MPEWLLQEEAMTDEELAEIKEALRKSGTGGITARLLTALEQERADLAAAQAERDAALEAAEWNARIATDTALELDDALERERLLRAALEQIAEPAPDEAPWTVWSPPEVRGVADWARRIAIGALQTAPAPEPEPEPTCQKCGSRDLLDCGDEGESGHEWECQECKTRWYEPQPES